MPFVSRAQQRFAFATKQPWAKKFAAATDFSRLPDRASTARRRALRSIRAERRRR